MTTYTLSTSISTGIELTASGAYGSPFTIFATGTIRASFGDALSSQISNASVLNFGVIDDLESIFLGEGGTITNTGPSARIDGYVNVFNRAATILNSAYIYQIDADYGLVTNAGNGSIGAVSLFGNGIHASTVLNSGIISSIRITNGTLDNLSVSSMIYAFNEGVAVSGLSSIANHGTIFGINYGIDGTGVKISNLGTASVIEGGKPDGYAYDSAIFATGYVMNQGTIRSGIGSLTRGTKAFVTDGYLSVYNNGRSAFISGPQDAILDVGQRVESTIRNQGTITSSQGYGVYMVEGSITNIGAASSIYGLEDGIWLGSDPGAQWGFGLPLTLGSAAVAVWNQGLIAGKQGYGIKIAGNATVTNSGTIAGAKAAIYFASGYADTLVVDPGAVFDGAVIAKGTADVVELAAGAGTVSGLGTQFAGFASLVLKAGAVWDIAGTTTIGAAVALTNDGTIAERRTDSLTIDSSITGNGVIKLGGERVVLKNTVGAGQAIEFTGTHQILTVGDAAGFAGTIGDLKTGDIIDLISLPFSHIKSTHFANGILTLTEAGTHIAMTFANPGSFSAGGLTVFKDGAGTGIKLASTVAASLHELHGFRQELQKPDAARQHAGGAASTGALASLSCWTSLSAFAAPVTVGS
jgi:hypothetical protein